MDLTLVLTDKDGYYTVEDQLTVPDHSRLEVYASNYMHTAIKSSGNGVEEDSTRCPTKIHLLEHKIIDRGGDGSYSDLSLYVTDAASQTLLPKPCFSKYATSIHPPFAFSALLMCVCAVRFW